MPRELLIALATLLCVATSAVAAAVAAAASESVAPAEAIDFDLTGDVDYEMVSDVDEDKSTDPDADVAEGPRFSSHARTGSNAAGLHHGHQHHGHHTNSKHNREVRCYCNQPLCVSTNYMCRGRGCFTDLPILGSDSTVAELTFRPEHASYSGCLDRSSAERDCPPGKLCCEQDLCNHIDSPAMRLRLNKTLQVLMGERRAYLGSGREDELLGADSWFRMATIAIPICGFVILVILASLAIRLLQPMPLQSDKLNGLRMPENAPPLLGPSKMPLV
ncbi:uncharacterized protein LOC106643386 [Copidosoma floridanum]|uniref:uncharacterized protein LOC106643386 n=1 Tax=Copidosoma floridanum TaxID=29053 RepID=UPI0006C96DA2|nr:uncharacterized protein LOC106643386 [Copidosoma floridanum]